MLSSNMQKIIYGIFYNFCSHFSPKQYFGTASALSPFVNKDLNLFCFVNFLSLSISYWLKKSVYENLGWVI